MERFPSWPSEQRLPRIKFALYATVAGGLHAIASSAHPSVEVLSPWLSLFSLFLLALLIQRTATFLQAFMIGWVFAGVWLTGSVWWLYISMHQYGGMPSLLAALAVFLLCFGLGLIYAFAMGMTRKMSPHGTLCTVSFAVFWMLAEILRGYIFTGFPWAASGYAHVDGLFAAYAPWLGVYGVSGVAALIAAVLALLLQYMLERWRGRRMLRPVHAVVGVVLLLVAVGAPWLLDRDFTESSGSVKVALLQGNVEQGLKFEQSTAEEAMRWYLEQMYLSKQQGVQLAIVPETAMIPYLLDRMSEDEQQQFYSLFESGQFSALMGAPVWDDEYSVTNSMIGLAPGQADYRYDKYHLVPFGEFVPPGFRWFVDLMEIPLGDMRRGPVDADSFAWAGQRIAPNICYEDIFGEELARRFAKGPEQPTIMANASNIAWFGKTVAIPQHLQIARMRALEFQRPMIRATNTGATAIVDYQGEVLSLLPSYTQGVLIEQVEGRNGLTPYVWWSGRWGLSPLLVLSLLALAFARLMQRKL